MSRIVFYTGILFTLVILGIVSIGYKGDTALFPIIVIIIGIMLVGLKLVTLLRPDLRSVLDPEGVFQNTSKPVPDGVEKETEFPKDLGKDGKRELVIVGWGSLFVMGIYFLGFFLGSAVFTFIFIKLLGKQKTASSLAVSICLPIVLYFVFNIGLKIQLYSGYFKF